MLGLQAHHKQRRKKNGGQGFHTVGTSASIDDAVDLTLGNAFEVLVKRCQRYVALRVNGPIKVGSVAGRDPCRVDCHSVCREDCQSDTRFGSRFRAPPGCPVPLFAGAAAAAAEGSAVCVQQRSFTKFRAASARSIFGVTCSSAGSCDSLTAGPRPCSGSFVSECVMSLCIYKLWDVTCFSKSEASPKRP